MLTIAPITNHPSSLHLRTYSLGECAVNHLAKDLMFKKRHSKRNVSISPHNHFMESDHNLITFDLAHCCLPQSFVIPQYVFDFPKADYEGLCSFLIDYDFSLLLSSNNVEFIWCFLKNSIHTAMNFYIPKVRLRKHQYPQWFTPELRHLTKCACS